MDYRFTWIRDSSFSVRALLGLGFTEAAQLVRWVGDRARESAAANGAVPLKIMPGSTAPPTSSRRPSITSAATRDRAGPDRQRGRRPDTAGHLRRVRRLRYEADRLGALPASYEGFQTFGRVLNWLSENWDQPGAGI